MKNHQILYLKSKIYQGFGIYLAQKEELTYIKSEEFWRKFNEISSHNTGMDKRDIQGLLVGSWQAQYGFCR